MRQAGCRAGIPRRNLMSDRQVLWVSFQEGPCMAPRLRGGEVGWRGSGLWQAGLGWEKPEAQRQLYHTACRKGA